MKTTGSTARGLWGAEDLARRPCVGRALGAQRASLLGGERSIHLRNARGVNVWPEMTVRSWRGVLERRNPGQYFWEPDDYSEEAEEARRIHELRGLIMAQVAEIEDLFRNLLSCAQECGITIKSAGRTAGAMAGAVGRLVLVLDLKDRYDDTLEAIRAVISRRNALVHATVTVGFYRIGLEGPRVPVIALLNHETDGGELSEVDLEATLDSAQEALEAAVDLWEAVCRRLPAG